MTNSAWCGKPSLQTQVFARRRQSLPLPRMAIALLVKLSAMMNPENTFTCQTLHRRRFEEVTMKQLKFPTKSCVIWQRQARLSLASSLPEEISAQVLASWLKMPAVPWRNGNSSRITVPAYSQRPAKDAGRIAGIEVL